LSYTRKPAGNRSFGRWPRWGFTDRFTDYPADARRLPYWRHLGQHKFCEFRQPAREIIYRARGWPWQPACPWMRGRCPGWGTAWREGEDGLDGADL